MESREPACENDIDRRRFLRNIGGAAGFLCLSSILSGCSGATDLEKRLGNIPKEERISHLKAIENEIMSSTEFGKGILEFFKVSPQAEILPYEKRPREGIILLESGVNGLYNSYTDTIHVYEPEIRRWPQLLSDGYPVLSNIILEESTHYFQDIWSPSDRLLDSMNRHFRLEDARKLKDYKGSLNTGGGDPVSDFLIDYALLTGRGLGSEEEMKSLLEDVKTEYSFYSNGHNNAMALNHIHTTLNLHHTIPYRMVKTYKDLKGHMQNLISGERTQVDKAADSLVELHAILQLLGYTDFSSLNVKVAEYVGKSQYSYDPESQEYGLLVNDVANLRKEAGLTKDEAQKLAGEYVTRLIQERAEFVTQGKAVATGYAKGLGG